MLKTHKLLFILIALAVSSCDLGLIGLRTMADAGRYPISPGEYQSMKVVFGDSLAKHLVETVPVYWAEDVGSYAAIYRWPDNVIYVSTKFRNSETERDSLVDEQVLVHEFTHAWLYSKGYNHFTLHQGKYRVSGDLTIENLGQEGVATAFQFSAILYHHPSWIPAGADGGEYPYYPWMAKLGSFVAKHIQDTKLPTTAEEAIAHRAPMAPSSRSGLQDTVFTLRLRDHVEH